MSDPAPAPDATPDATPAAKPNLLSGEGKTPDDYRAGLSDEMGTNPALANLDSVDKLAKSYLSAQKLIGKEKVVRPNDKSTPEEWGEFFDAGGRPKDAGDYKFEVKEGSNLPLSEEKVEAFKAFAHEQGFSAKQAASAMDHYVGITEAGVKEANAAFDQQQSESIEALRNDWGPKYDENVELANRALRTFGDDETIKFLAGDALGNNAGLVRMMSKIGQSCQEDAALGSGKGLLATKGQAAAAEIQTLIRDPEFMKALNTRNAPGHEGAVEQWKQLHAQAGR